MYETVKEILKEKGLDGILVSDGYNMRYLSGFTGAAGYLYFTLGRKILLTDSRYTTQARRETKGFEILEAAGSRGYGGWIRKITQEDQVRTLGFEDANLSYAAFRSLERAAAKIDWIPLEDTLNRLRMVKTQEELVYLEAAEEIGDKAFRYILDELKPGVTELQIAAKLEYFMKEQGAQGTSFDTIVASGIHSAMPHAVPTEKVIAHGEFVTMDFGCVYRGYCSDMTRTVVVGKASERQRELYQTVLKAQLAALQAIRPGVTGSEVDQIARTIIADAGYGECFGHGLGHGVGLFIHEEPRLSPNCHEVLREGVIQTVEPGIYLPDFGGVRIEDMVAVTAKGCKNLTHSPKELIEL